VALDLAALTSTPDLRQVSPVHARLVAALRYTHIARRAQSYRHADLAQRLGSHCGVHSFHVFLDEAGRAWPDPITLNPPCQPLFSYDEMLLVDLATAAARGDRGTFDDLVRDMIGIGGRNALWSAGRRLMRCLVTVAD
jgi:hypothetical protein